MTKAEELANESIARKILTEVGMHWDKADQSLLSEAVEYTLIRKRSWVRVPRSMTPLSVKFDEKVIKKEGCWGWSGNVSNRGGYGVLNLLRKSFQAHRVAWRLFRGEIPDGLFVCHTCDNPPCTNPDHLWLGDVGDNTRDCVAKGRHRGLKPGNKLVEARWNKYRAIREMPLP